MRIIVTLICVMCAHASNSATAELRQCDGVWTNKNCSSESTEALPEVHKKEPDPNEIAKSQKESWLTDLDLKRLQAQRDLGVDIDIATASLICNNEDSKVLECREAIDAKQKEITALLAAVTSATRSPSPTATQVSNTTAVTIIEQDVDIHGRHRHGRPRWNDRPRSRPEWREPDYKSEDRKGDGRGRGRGHDDEPAERRSSSSGQAHFGNSRN